MNPATLSGPNHDRSMTPAMRASRLLGWVSLAIGAAELLAPRKVAGAVGMREDQALLLRACGARQIATGIGAHSVYPVPALWARMGGDMADLAILAVTARSSGDGRSSEDGRGSQEGRVSEGKGGKGPWLAMAAVGGLAVLSAVVASRLAAETAEGKNTGEPRDYSDRSGFPQGVEAARGAGIVREALAGKAGGAAAGDVSPAGEASTGRSSTDLAGAPVGGGSASGTSGPSGPQGQSSAAEGSGFIGGGQTMPEESQKVIPEPPSYTPA